MPSSGRVRRTELTCPGGSLRMAAKAAGSAADEVILDLEDSVAPSAKAAARAAVIEAIRTLDWGDKIVAFRPNGFRTEWAYRDIIEVVEGAGERLDVMVIPKANGPEEIHYADFLLTQIEARLGRRRPIRIEALIESAAAVLRAHDIARASDRMESLCFGIGDYAGDLGARDIMAEQFGWFLYPKHQVLVAARAAGIDALDNITLDVRDPEAAHRDAQRSARLGFDGKWAIHPAQVQPINDAFTPSAEEIAAAQRYVDAYARAGAEAGRGAITAGDEMVDAATVRIEARKLAVARKAGRI